ncbi:hypothetical protein V6Z12_D08G142500 [Gossypium hirsutum]
MFHFLSTKVSLWLLIDCVCCVVIMCEASEPLEFSSSKAKGMEKLV